MAGELAAWAISVLVIEVRTSVARVNVPRVVTAENFDFGISIYKVTFLFIVGFPYSINRCANIT